MSGEIVAEPEAALRTCGRAPGVPRIDGITLASRIQAMDGNNAVWRLAVSQRSSFARTRLSQLRLRCPIRGLDTAGAEAALVLAELIYARGPLTIL